MGIGGRSATVVSVAGRVTVKRLSPAEGCLVIVGNTFRLDMTDRAQHVRMLEAAAEIAESLPVLELHYPREFARLNDVRNAVQDAVQDAVDGLAPRPPAHP